MVILSQPKIEVIEFKSFINDTYKNVKVKFKPNKLAINLWVLSGIMLSQGKVHAAETANLWVGMQPVFAIFRDVMMVVGTLAIFAGLTVMVFKKRLGINIITSSALIIGGCFLVPSLVMLVGIVGGMINDTLIEVFKSSGFNNSVKVGG